MRNSTLGFDWLSLWRPFHIWQENILPEISTEDGWGSSTSPMKGKSRGSTTWPSKRYYLAQSLDRWVYVRYYEIHFRTTNGFKITYFDWATVRNVLSNCKECLSLIRLHIHLYRCIWTKEGLLNLYTLSKLQLPKCETVNWPLSSITNFINPRPARENMTDVYFNCIAFKAESAVAREPGFLPGRLQHATVAKPWKTNMVRCKKNSYLHNFFYNPASF